MGVTVRLESALELVKKMERAKGKHWSNDATKASWRNPKNLQGRFCTNSYFIKFVGENRINQMEVTGKVIKDTFEADFFSPKPVWAK